MALVGTNGQGVGTSPFSEWVKKASELELPADEKQQLDSFIDKLYEDLNEGGTASTGIVGHFYEFAFLEPFYYKMLTHATVIVEIFTTKFYCGSF
jgi:hypothetical protein